MADELKIVILDLETGGFSPKKHDIVEVGMALLKDDRVAKEANWLMVPERPMSQGAIDTHGITEQLLRQSVTTPRADVLEKIISALEWADVAVAYNAKFDMSFLHAFAEWGERQLPEVEVIDALACARRFFPELNKHKLELVAEHLGLSVEGSHRAIYDVMLTRDVLAECARRAGYTLPDLLRGLSPASPRPEEARGDVMLNTLTGFARQGSLFAKGRTDD